MLSSPKFKKYGRNDSLWKLREGWRADIVGLSTDTTRATPLYDAFAHLGFPARGEDVEFAMVDDEVLLADGGVKVADSAAIRQQAREVTESFDLRPHANGHRKSNLEVPSRPSQQ